MTAPVGKDGLATGGSAGSRAAGVRERLHAGGSRGSPGHKAAGGSRSGSASVGGVSVSTGSRNAGGDTGGERSDSLSGGALDVLAVVTTSLVVDGGRGLSGALEKSKLVCNIHVSGA